MKHRDSRIKIVNEVLNGIKVIKLYAWEIPFQQQIMGVRKLELGVLKTFAYIGAVFSFTWTCAPFLVRNTLCSLESYYQPKDTILTLTSSMIVENNIIMATYTRTKNWRMSSLSLVVTSRAAVWRYLLFVRTHLCMYVLVFPQALH